MTLPASGQLGLVAIGAEFGDTGEVKLLDQYGKGGAPSSGELSIKDFYGRANFDVLITEAAHEWQTNNWFYGMDLDVNFTNPPIVPFGSADPTSFNGATIERCFVHKDAGPYDFTIIVSGNRARSWFTTITPEGLAALPTATSNQYLYSSSFNSTMWSWYNTGQGGWDGTGTRTLIFT